MVDSPASGTGFSGAGGVSRRTLISTGAGVAALVVTGCSGEKSSRGAAAPTGAAGLSPDVAVATTALAEIRSVRVAATSTLTRFPPLRPDLRPLVGMHQIHEKSLADAVPDQADPAVSGSTIAPYVVPRGRAAALARLAEREQRLHDTLGTLALTAQSGDFARLLASMGAAIGQRLAGWPA